VKHKAYPAVKGKKPAEFLDVNVFEGDRERSFLYPLTALNRAAQTSRRDSCRKDEPGGISPIFIPAACTAPTELLFG